MPEESAIKQAKLELERQKLAIEEKKLGIEGKKLHLEIVKAKWTAVSIVLPVLVIAATITWGVIATRLQAKLTFQLEAAKTVMTADTYADQVTRATFLRDNFPDQLGDDFLKKLDLRDFPDAPNVAAKIRFVDLIAARGLTPEETAELYHILFSDDDSWWRRDEVLAILSKSSIRMMTSNNAGGNTIANTHGDKDKIKNLPKASSPGQAGEPETI
jgi:hypothetical protein